MMKKYYILMFSVFFVVQAFSNPDLIVESISVTPAYAWRTSVVEAVVRNVGTSSAEFALADNICRFEVDGQVDYSTEPSTLSIPTGGVYIASAEFVISTTGVYSVTAFADSDNIVVEDNDSNNSFTNTVTWTASPIHDTDGDGMIDADEVIAGSDPNNSASVWACSLVLTNGGFRLSWPSISGRTYTVERSTILTNGFIAISPPLPAYPPLNWFESVNMPINAFYRIKVED